MAGPVRIEMNGPEDLGDGAPKVEDVLSQIRDVLEILEGVENAVAQERGESGNAIDWRVAGASRNSPFVLELTPCPRKAAMNIDGRALMIVPAAMDGIRKLMEGENLPPYFSRDLIKTTKRLCRRIANGLDATTLEASTYVQAPRISITNEDARRALSNLMRFKGKELVYRRELGSVEGRISKIGRDKNGHLVLWLRSRIDGKTIKCVGDGCAFDGIGENQVAEFARGLRVLVLGILKYEKPGKIGVIETDEIRVFKKNDELPDIYDIVDPNFTGGVESCEHLRRIRENG